MNFAGNRFELIRSAMIALAALAQSASAEVLFNLTSSTPIQYASLETTNAPPQWNSGNAGQYVPVTLSGSDLVEFQGYTEGYLSFIALATGPSTVGPTFSLAHSFILTSGIDGTGTVLLAGTGTSTLTRGSDSTVVWTSSTISNFLTQLIQAGHLMDGKFTFTATSNTPIPVGTDFPEFSSFALSGQFTADVVTSVPEPSSLMLLAVGGLSAGVVGIRRYKARR